MVNALPTSRADAVSLDEADPLKEAREHFELPEGTTYLVGHSLGPVTSTAKKRLRETTDRDWAEGVVRSWNSAGWIDLGAAVGAKLAPLIGVDPKDVVVCDSVSVNLFKLAVAALPLAEKQDIIVEEDEFPTDRYIANGLARTVGAKLRMVDPGNDLDVLREGGVLIKSAVNFRSAAIVDIAAYEKVASESGGVVIWDLSHATGVIPLDLAEAGAKFATGCTYKYLNGGPGAPSFIYVRRDVAERVETPLPGWLGHAEPFAFETDYRPAEGVLRFVAGTPSILSLVALDGALDAFDGVEPAALAAKARGLGDVVIARATGLGLDLQSPYDSAARGGHVSLGHPEGYPIVRALAARGILADFRTPDTIRFGLSPLYLRYQEVWDVMDVLEGIIDGRLWDRPEFKIREKVT